MFIRQISGVKNNCCGGSLENRTIYGERPVSQSTVFINNIRYIFFDCYTMKVLTTDQLGFSSILAIAFTCLESS